MINTDETWIGQTDYSKRNGGREVLKTQLKTLSLIPE